MLKDVELEFLNHSPHSLYFSMIQSDAHGGCGSRRLKRPYIPYKTKLLTRRQKTLSQRRSRRSPSTFGTGADVSMSWTPSQLDISSHFKSGPPTANHPILMKLPGGLLINIMPSGLFHTRNIGDGLPKVLSKLQEPDTYGNISMDDVKKYGAVTS